MLVVSLLTCALPFGETKAKPLPFGANANSAPRKRHKVKGVSLR